MGPPLRLLVPGWRELGLCLLGMDPSLSHSHLPAAWSSQSVLMF